MAMVSYVKGLVFIFYMILKFDCSTSYWCKMKCLQRNIVLKIRLLWSFLTSVLWLRNISALILLLNCVEISEAQYRIQEYNFTNGLDISAVKNIIQDKKGHIWLGSHNGLVRFDGLEFVSMLPLLDEVNVKGMEVSEFDIDSKGRVWMSFLEGGLAVYDHDQQSFISRNYEPQDSLNFPKLSILQIEIDSSNDLLWMVSVLEGVFVMDLNTFKSKKVLDFKKPFFVVVDPHRANTIYVSSAEGTFRVNTETQERALIYEYTLHKMELEKEVLYGMDWSSTMHRLNLDSGQYSTIDKRNGTVNNDLIKIGNEVWASDKEGLYKLDFEVGKMKSIDLEGLNSKEVETNAYFDIHVDHKENIWVGTEEGLIVIHQDFQKLNCLEDLSNIRITDIVPSHQNDVFLTISFHDNVIQKVDLNQNKVYQIENSTELRGPLTIENDSATTWILFYNGLGYIDDNKRIASFNDKALDAFFKEGGVGDMKVDKSGIIWMIKKGNPNLLELNNGKLQKHLVPELGSHHLKNLKSDSLGVWIGTERGICRFDIQTSHMHWVKVENDFNNIGQDRIEYMDFDDDKYLWIMSLKYGAYRAKVKDAGFVLEIVDGLNQTNGMANHRPWDFSVYKPGQFVFGSSGGLSVFDKNKRTAKSFGRVHGFQHSRLESKSIGNRVFGLSYGLCYFDDIDFFEEEEPLKVQLFASLYGVSGDGIDWTNLSYDQNDVSVKYHAVSMTYPRTVKYRYRLQKEEEWTIVGYNHRDISFSDLSHGTYHFEIQAKDRDTDWGPSSLLKFQIKPPFWKTWWFLCIALCVIVLPIIMFYRYREQNLRQLGTMQQRMNDLENEALRAQMNPHFIFNSLNSIKSYIIHNDRGAAADYLTTFAQLIRFVLENSREQFISLWQEKQALDLYMDIENRRLNDKFEVRWFIHPSINLNQTLIPPLSLQPFIENAIWHGFMHKKGDCLLKIELNRIDDKLNIVIEDNGVGREISKSIEQKYQRKRSFGIAVTRERLVFKNRITKVNIMDLKNQKNEAAGTKVEIVMPLITKAKQDENEVGG